MKLLFLLFLVTFSVVGADKCKDSYRCSYGQMKAARALTAEALRSCSISNRRFSLDYGTPQLRRDMCDYSADLGCLAAQNNCQEAFRCLSTMVFESTLSLIDATGRCRLWSGYCYAQTLYGIDDMSHLYRNLEEAAETCDFDRPNDRCGIILAQIQAKLELAEDHIDTASAVCGAKELPDDATRPYLDFSA